MNLSEQNLIDFFPSFNYTFWKGKKVLVTGHSGFKGSWLCLWLLELGADVIGFSLPPDNEKSLFYLLGIEKFISHNIGDIRNKDSINYLITQTKPDIIFHLAAQPIVRTSYSKPVLTWETNVMGTVNLLDCLKDIDHECSTVFITTDKVYKNQEWTYGYREIDELGGHDPYSSSKAASEIAIESWRSSFCVNNNGQNSKLFIASARSGNVIGGGDWAKDRIIPDVIRSLKDNRNVLVRNPNSTRPWQHVLEPLGGYLSLAKALLSDKGNRDLTSSFNFGPKTESNRTVRDLVNTTFKYWDGKMSASIKSNSLHESNLLNLSIDKAYKYLGWYPFWNFNITVEKTINWYKKVLTEEESPLCACKHDLKSYQDHILSINKLNN